MQPDLQGLEITKGELKHLTNVRVDSVFRPPTTRKFLAEILKTISIISLICVSCVISIVGFPEYYLLAIAIHLFMATLLVIEDTIKIFKSNKFRNLIRLLEDVDRYNATIRSIDINDKIEAAGNPQVRLKDRERVMEALKLTREDIVRALKTERILRENERFIKLNPDLFANNLTALAALQIDERANEYGRILNEAFQIGMSLQDEMKKLQNKHLSK